MRKVIIILWALILLAVLSNRAMAQYGYFNSSSHNAIIWGYYGISGSLSVDFQSSNKDDSLNYAPYGTSLKIGKTGLNKGTIINTPANHLSIPSPRMGMLAFDTTLKQFYGYNGTNWLRLDSAGSSGSAFDTTYIYAALSDTAAAIRADFPSGGSTDTTSLSNRINAKQNFTDTTTWDATRWWVQSQGYLTSFSETDPIFTASDAFGVTSTLISNWTAAYNDKINSAAVTGTGSKTLTLTQQDGGTVTAGFTDLGADTAIWATQSDIAGFVPYTGANANVNLGVHTMQSTRVATDTIEPNTSAGLHIHNASHQDIMIAGAGGGQTLTIAAPTNMNAAFNVTNSASAIAANFQGSNTSYRLAATTTSTGAGLQSYNDGLNSVRSMHVQASGGNIRIGSGTISGYGMQINRKTWINPDSVATGSTGTDDVVMLSNGEIKRIAVGSLLSGAVDSSVYVTVTRLRDSLQVMRDSVAALRASIPVKVGGTATFSGTGSQTTFSIPHGLGQTPTTFYILPKSAATATAGRMYVTADATNINFIYQTAAPALGTDNVILVWEATK